MRSASGARGREDARRDATGTRSRARVSGIRFTFRVSFLGCKNDQIEQDSIKETSCFEGADSMFLPLESITNLGEMVQPPGRAAQ